MPHGNDWVNVESLRGKLLVLALKIKAFGWISDTYILSSFSTAIFFKQFFFGFLRGYTEILI
jgi:hypothetical protein